MQTRRIATYSGASSLEKGVCCERTAFHTTFQHKTTLSLNTLRTGLRYIRTLISA